MRKTPEFVLISMAAEMLDMHPQTLRKYERLGLVRPSRTLGSMRVYTRDELDRLRRIKALVDDARDQPGRRAAAALDRGSRRAAAPAPRRGSASRRADARKLSSELDELFRLLGLDDLD